MSFQIFDLNRLLRMCSEVPLRLVCNCSSLNLIELDFGCFDYQALERPILSSSFVIDNSSLSAGDSRGQRITFEHMFLSGEF